MVPQDGELRIELYGELAALLRLGSASNAKHLLAGAEEVQVSMVAGAGFEPAAFRL